MTRQQEITLVLKQLLIDAICNIDGNQQSYDGNNIIQSSKALVKTSKEIEKYLTELDKL